MDVDILTTDEAVETIENRLLDGFVILDAPLDVLRVIEEHIYTPGTPANADYEIIGFLPSIHLGRKTEKLKAFLQDPPEWATLQFVALSHPEGKQVSVMLEAFDPAILTKEQAAGQLAAKAGEYLTMRR